MNNSANVQAITGFPPATADDHQTVWERVAQSRWGQYVTEIEKEAIMDAQRAAGPPERAIEIGCEGGRWSRLLSDEGWDMTCVDVDANALEACRKKNPSARLILERPESRTIDGKDSEFSLVLCVEVAPVIQSDWFLPEAFRILKPGGILLAVVWNKISIRGLAHRLHEKEEENAISFYRDSYYGWRKRLRAAGFNLLNAKGFCWGPFGRSSNSSLIPFFTSFERNLGLQSLAIFSPWVICLAQKPKAS
jgi:SAM-dependent methyltransferase